MYIQQVEQINKDLERTGKAIVAFGCSFVQGQGAIDDELYEDYTWEYVGEGHVLEPKFTRSEEKALLKKYKDTIFRNREGKLEFTFMEYENAFVSVLSKKYFNGEYTPINFGIRGCGNRGSIKEIYFNNGINWDLAKEVIVLYTPSGVERFDFINDSFSDHFRWVCMWPHYKGMEEGSGRRILWEGYAKALWSEKFELLEQIGHVKELMLWAKSKNAKMVITPGFDRKYNREYFEHILGQEVERKLDSTTHKLRKPLFMPVHRDINLVDEWPWDLMFRPEGHSTFVELAMSKEELTNDRDYYFQFLGKRSENGWMTPCAHPGQKAHDLFAKLLHEHITKNLS